MADTALLWVRRDLRLADNPALRAAAHHRQLLVVVLDEGDDRGSAAAWWYAASLERFDRRLSELGARLLLLQGDPRVRLPELARRHGVEHCYWNRRSTPEGIVIDRAVKATLREQGHACHSFNAALLREPWTLATQQGAPYRVFTPFWKRLRTELTCPEVVPAPTSLPPPPQTLGDDSAEGAIPAAAIGPDHPWTRRLAAVWTPGEEAALSQLEAFRSGPLFNYAEQRDRPAVAGTSRLSPHLTFGEIGPRQILAALWSHGGEPDAATGPATFMGELGWREFAHAVLFHFPQTATTAMNPVFRDFPWQRGARPEREDWQRGRTGIPLVDAGMRELWQTGWMHNRVRMVAASWLTKNLLHDWRDGRDWFGETLVDADPANNTLGWQWVAGCGVDAAPWFRIFNPVRQAERFDPEGAYIARWVPELAGLPPRWRAQPWRAPAAVLEAAGLRLGRDYPFPHADPASSREAALAAYRGN